MCRYILSYGFKYVTHLDPCLCSVVAPICKVPCVLGCLNFCMNMHMCFCARIYFFVGMSPEILSNPKTRLASRFLISDCRRLKTDSSFSQNCVILHKRVNLYDNLECKHSFSCISPHKNSAASKTHASWAGTGVTTYSLHPGIVVTDAARHVDTTLFPGAKWLFENVFVYFVKTCEQGAQTTIHCAVSEEAGTETGLYYR